MEIRQTAPPRWIEIDFFRGLALLFILVDHISGTVLGKLTLCNYSIADASEVFVFLSGLVTVTAYQRIAHKKSPRDANRRFYRRAVEIYFVYLLVALLMLVCGMCLYLLDLETPALELTEVLSFLESPSSFLSEVLLLRRQPYFSDILPMYGIFALLTPALIRVARRSVLRLLSASVALWLVAPWLASLVLPNVPGGHWTFNPFAWQLVYMLGLAVGVAPEWFTRWSPTERRILTGSAALYALSAAAFVILQSYPGLRAHVLPAGSSDLVFLISKEHASSWRVVSFLAVAWLVYSACSSRRGRPVLKALAHKASLVTTVGRNSLECFIATAVLSIFAEGFTYAFASAIPGWYRPLVGDLLAVTLLLAFAAWIDARTRARRSPPASRIPSGVLA